MRRHPAVRPESLRRPDRVPGRARRGLAAVVVALAAVAASASVLTPATASPVPPPKVDPVQIVGNDLTSQRLDWWEVRRATSYRVFLSTRMDLGDSHLIQKVRTTEATVTGLTPGTTYCYQVQAFNHRVAGRKSPRSCKTTVVATGTDTGPVYRVLTYNLCSAKCDGWDRRLPGAVDQIEATDPDVVALQEAKSDAGIDAGLGSAYRLARYKSAKQLFYRTDRFTLARSGEIYLGGGSSYGVGGHWAVWADLIDRTASQRHVIFVDAHFAPGGDTVENDAARRENMTRLLDGVSAANPYDYSVVYAGDYNSHKHRVHNSPAELMNAAGYVDSYDLAATLTRPNYNTAHPMSTTPNIGNTWGDHVDHVWVDPYTTRVLSWANASPMNGRAYAAPVPSNHSPMLVVLQVN